jgi:hypothetical protein
MIVTEGASYHERVMGKPIPCRRYGQEPITAGRDRRPAPVRRPPRPGRPNAVSQTDPGLPGVATGP